MSQHISVSFDECVEGLHAHDGPVLFVLPTTRAMVDTVLRRNMETGRLLIGDPAIISSALDPAHYLAACQQAEDRGEWAPSAYAFTDQFVDAPIATLLVQHGGRQEFMSATEVLARSNYAVDVHVWTQGGLVRVSTTHVNDPVPVLRALAVYYENCASLGEHWLMRERQRRRQPEARLNSAARRLRLYESVVMQTFDELHEQARVLLRDLGARRSVLMDEMEART